MFNGSWNWARTNWQVIALAFALGGSVFAAQTELEDNTAINAQQAAILDRLQSRQESESRERKAEDEKEAQKRRVADFCLEREIPLEECPL